jgi:hypothetical protein
MYRLPYLPCVANRPKRIVCVAAAHELWGSRRLLSPTMVHMMRERPQL